MAHAGAMRAGDEGGFRERGAQALAAHFHQAEMAYGADLDTGAVVLQRVLELALDGGVVFADFHVDEVDDDEAGEVAHAQLLRDFLGGLHVGAKCCVLDAALAGGAAGIDVDGDERLGLVDDDIAAGAQLHDGVEHGIQLGFDLVAGEEGLAFGPELHFPRVARHEHAHEVAGGAETVLAIDQDVVHIAGIDIADGALDEAGFLIDQRRGGGFHGAVADVVPEAEEILAVALDFGFGAVGAGGAHDQAHAVRHVELGHRLFQAAAVGDRRNLARNPAAGGRIGHQHREAAGEREIGGQRRTFIAALLLDHLDQHDLAAVDDLLDFVVAQETLALAALTRFRGVIAVAADVFRRRRGLGLCLDDVDAFDLFHLFGRLGRVFGGLRGGIAEAFCGLGIFNLGLRRLVGCGFGQGVSLARRFRRRRSLYFDGLDFKRLRGFYGWRRRLAVILVGFVRGGVRRLLRQQPLPVRDRDLVIIRMNFAKGEETVPVAAIFDKRRLQAGFDPDNLGEVDIAFYLLPVGCLNVEIFKPVAVQYHHARLFRVAGVDEHFFRHKAQNSDARLPAARRRRLQGQRRRDFWVK